MTDESQTASAPLPEPAELRRILVERFNLDELRNLCQDLKIDYDSLPGEGKEAKARELIAYCQRHERIPELWAAIDRAKPEPPLPGECPFKGLQYFDEADADLFFGREQLTAKLVERLRQDRFLAVVGASGSGKSSVVRAGLVPALKRGKPLTDGTLPPEGSQDWVIHVITPTAHPLKELAVGLTRDESTQATTDLIDALACDARSLDLAVSKLVKRTGKSRLLLVVDQFEELFTACKDKAEHKAFVSNLLHAAASETGGPTIVMIALRADFYHHCAQFDNLREALSKCQEYIGPMNASELRRAIEEPARRNEWDFEQGLVDSLLDDVGDEPGNLPLLSHALLETWNHREGHRLTHRGYKESGKVSGAIAKTADAVYSKLGPGQQSIARNIFLRLTELGEGSQDTRRRAALAELARSPEDPSIFEAVLKTLADARLVVTTEEAVEVAHEALIREWPRLREWLAQEGESLRIHRRLTDTTNEWDKSNRDKSYLYQGARLAQVNKWAESHINELNALEQEFLEASRVMRLRELAKRRAWQGIGAAVGTFALLLIALEIRNYSGC